MTESELLDLKQEIEETKTRVAELKGQKQTLLNQLKNNWKCTTIEQANKLLADMKIEIAKLDKEITERSNALREKYDV